MDSIENDSFGLEVVVEEEVQWLFALFIDRL